jgi:BirA family transcriptional regulator, biotin operon repressor / biotin---[acetyl-CoA-carboxylase] ligase
VSDAPSMTPFLARREHLARVGSTNDVVRDWLAAGTPEVCLVVADEQTAGRGRDGRSWVAPPDAALLVSLGFRPTWLAPAQAWRLAAVASLAMAEAAETTAGLAPGAVRLKWPNDLVIAMGDGSGPGGVRKIGGVLGETSGLGTPDPRAVIGLGVNADWSATDFPADIAATMTSLRELAGRRIEREDLLTVFEAYVEPRIAALRTGRFDGAAWAARQVTTGRQVRLETAQGIETVRATGVDPGTGALLVADPGRRDGIRQVLVGEVTHVRLGEPVAGQV